MRELSQTSPSENHADKPATLTDSNASVSNLIQLYETTNKSSSPKENKNSPISDHATDDSKKII